MAANPTGFLFDDPLCGVAVLVDGVDGPWTRYVEVRAVHSDNYFIVAVG